MKIKDLNKNPDFIDKNYLIDLNKYDMYHLPTKKKIVGVEDLSKCNSSNVLVKLTLEDGSIVTETKEENVIYINKNER